MTAGALRLFLLFFGLVAVVAGLSTVLVGGESVLGAEKADAAIESELRFYSAWWVGAGLVLWWIARDVASRGRELRVLSAVLMLAALARVVAWIDVGRPTDGQVALLVVEVVLALGLPLWQTRSARDPHGSSPSAPAARRSPPATRRAR